MRIGIIGTRGIPNNYGGFEQFAQFLSVQLVRKGVDVSVYNSHSHPYQEESYENVNIIHCYDPEDKIGTIGQFIYDLNCINDARKRRFDIILQLGYTSNSVWAFRLPREVTIVTNMDGLEWKRSKYSNLTKKFLLFAEKWAVNSTDVFISDSIGIQSYLKNKFDIESIYIPYGAIIHEESSKNELDNYSLKPFQYSMILARMEPENNIETIIQGHIRFKDSQQLIIVGGFSNTYGKFLNRNYSSDQIRFLGPIYDQSVLHSLKKFSNLYFHGHSVGGTNPSLLEAMASGCLICANKNVFNECILGDDAFYFSNAFEISTLLDSGNLKKYRKSMVSNNLKKIKEIYNWEMVVDQYYNVFRNCLNNVL